MCLLGVIMFLGLMTALCLVAAFMLIVALVLVACGLTFGGKKRQEEKIEEVR